MFVEANLATVWKQLNHNSTIKYVALLKVSNSQNSKKYWKPLKNFDNKHDTKLHQQINITSYGGDFVGGPFLHFSIDGVQFPGSLAIFLVQWQPFVTWESVSSVPASIFNYNFLKIIIDVYFLYIHYIFLALRVVRFHHFTHNETKKLI